MPKYETIIYHDGTEGWRETDHSVYFESEDEAIAFAYARLRSPDGIAEVICHSEVFQSTRTVCYFMCGMYGHLFRIQLG
jgi:hypothetical protein